MARPLLLSAGSRGDYEPLTALSIGLASSSETDVVTYCVQTDFISSVPGDREKLKIVKLPYGLPEMFPSLRKAFEQAAPGATGLEVTWTAFGMMIRDIIMPTTDLVVSAARESECDVVVTCLGSWPVAHVVSKCLNIPLVMLSFQPDMLSLYYPHLNLEPRQCAERMVRLQRGEIPEPSQENLDIGKSLHRLHFDQYAATFEGICTKYGVPTVSFEQLVQVFASTAPNMATIIAVQPGLAPSPPDVTDNTFVVGSLAVDYIPDGYHPQTDVPELCSFLENGDPPIVVSFGSLGEDADGVRLTRILINGMKQCDVKRAVILPGNANIGIHRLCEDDDDDDVVLVEWAKERVITVKGNVQYAWLLPQCEMLYCHGGAGSTSAALYAGIPLLITPIMFDQMFFAELVKLMGLGTIVGSEGFDSITADLVAKGIQYVRSPAVVEKVVQFSQADKQNENAVHRAVSIIHKIALGK